MGGGGGGARKLLPAALARAWGGGAEVARVALPARKGPRELLFVLAAQATSM